MANTHNGIFNVGAALEQLAMVSTTFAQLVEMNALLTSKLEEAYVQNSTLVDIIKTLKSEHIPHSVIMSLSVRPRTVKTGSNFTTPNCDCFSGGYEFIMGHISATCNCKTSNHSANSNLNNAIRSNTLGGITKKNQQQRSDRLGHVTALVLIL